jgi:hypothetical protein
MKKLLRNIIEFGASLTIGAGLLFGGAFGLNQLLNNGEYISEYSHSKTLPDAFGNTEFTKYSCGSILIYKIYKSGPFSYNRFFIEDGDYKNNPDGIADEITFSEGNKRISISREKGYAKYKERFDEADRIMKEETERFEPYFE